MSGRIKVVRVSRSDWLRRARARLNGAIRVHVMTQQQY